MRTFQLRLTSFYFFATLCLGLWTLGTVSAGTVINRDTEQNYHHDLQKAINEANTGNTLELEGDFIGNFKIDNKQSLTLTANSASFIKGNSGVKESVFSILNSNNIRLVRLHISRGENRGITNRSSNTSLRFCRIRNNTTSGDGGAIYTTHSLVAESCHIEDNRVDGNGGGVFIEGAQVEFKNCTIIGNLSNLRKRSGIEGGGGVFLSRGTATFSNSEILSNECRQGQGGGIRYTNQSTLILNDTKVKENRSPPPSEQIYPKP